MLVNAAINSVNVLVSPLVFLNAVATLSSRVSTKTLAVQGFFFLPDFNYA